MDKLRNGRGDLSRPARYGMNENFRRDETRFACSRVQRVSRTDKTTGATKGTPCPWWNTLRVLRKGGWPTRVDKKIFMKITENL